MSPYEAQRHHEVLTLTHWLLRRQSIRSTGQLLPITQEQIADYFLWYSKMHSFAKRDLIPDRMLQEIHNRDANLARYVYAVTGLGTPRKAGYLGAMDVFFPMVNVKPQGR